MKRKSILALMPSAIIGIAALAGCGQQPATIDLVNSNSQFVLGWNDGEHTDLATYELSDRKGLPYADVRDFASAVSMSTNVSYSLKRDDEGTYALSVHGSNDYIFKANAEKDTLQVGSTISAFGKYLSSNNGVAGDYGSPQDTNDCLVHTSDKTKVIGTPNAPVHNMKDYGMDFVEKDGKLYMPTQLLGNLISRGLGMDFTHNGRDLYLSRLVEQNIGVGTSFYSANGQFILRDTTGAIAFSRIDPYKDRLDGRKEAYRFSGASRSLEDGSEGTCFLILFEDGTGLRTFSAIGSPENEKEDFNPGDMGYSYEYRWRAVSDVIVVERTIVRKDHEGQTQKTTDATYRIALGAGWYNAKTRPQSLIDFSYGLLRFQIDHEYGLKEIKKISSAESFIQSLGVKEGLLSPDSSVYDDALAKLLLTGIDDGHTLYTAGSLFSGPSAIDVSALQKKHFGPRYSKLAENAKTCNELRDQYFRSLGTEEETNKYFSPDKPLQKGLFTYESTAIIRFDAFTYAQNYIKRYREIGQPLDFSIEPYSVVNTDTPTCWTIAFNKIAKDSKIKDVVIDLTCNGGGMIMCVPYLAAFFSEDPHFATFDVSKGVVNDYHYKVDLNNDGKYGEEGDTFKGKYNFYFLTSGFSFSCGNALPSIAKEAGAKIIGARSGGGTSSVAAYTDGCGSFYNLSSHIQMTIKDGDKYVDNDAGVPLDKEWAPCVDWYNPAKVHEQIQSMK